MSADEVVCGASAGLGGPGVIDLAPVPADRFGCAGCNDPHVRVSRRLRIGYRDARATGEGQRTNVEIHLCRECLAAMGDEITSALRESR